MITVTWEERTSDESPASDLLDAFCKEIASMYEGFSFDVGPSATKADFTRPKGCYIVGFVGIDGETEAVAGGGVKLLSNDTAEIKRMYVVGAHRGKGVGRQLLESLEDAAKTLGASKVRLDTGPQQVKALRIYKASGYAQIPDYNGNPFASHWFQKDLSSVSN